MAPKACRKWEVGVDKCWGRIRGGVKSIQCSHELRVCNKDSTAHYGVCVYSVKCSRPLQLLHTVAIELANYPAASTGALVSDLSDGAAISPLFSRIKVTR